MDCAELDAAAMGIYTSDDASDSSSDQLWWILMLVGITVGVLVAVVGALVWKIRSSSDASSQMQKAAEPTSVAL